MVKISDEQDALVKKLYAQGKKISEIVEEVGISRSAVYNRTRLRERGFKSYEAYRNFRLEERGFTPAEYRGLILKKRKFTPAQYRKYLAERQGYDSYQEIIDKWAVREHGSMTKYRHAWAKRKKYADYNDYLKKSEVKRMKRPKNKRVSGLIREALKESGKTQTEAARELGVNKWTFYKYFSGRMIPRKEKWGRLAEILGVGVSDLEEVLNE